MIFAVQQPMIPAPNLTSKESRKDWEMAFSMQCCDSYLDRMFPFFCVCAFFGTLKWFHTSFSTMYINFANKASHDVMNT